MRPRVATRERERERCVLTVLDEARDLTPVLALRESLGTPEVAVLVVVAVAARDIQARKLRERGWEREMRKRGRCEAVKGLRRRNPEYKVEW